MVVRVRWRTREVIEVALSLAIGIGVDRLPEGGLHFNLLVGLVLISYAYHSFQKHCHTKSAYRQLEEEEILWFDLEPVIAKIMVCTEH